MSVLAHGALGLAAWRGAAAPPAPAPRHAPPALAVVTPEERAEQPEEAPPPSLEPLTPAPEPLPEEALAPPPDAARDEPPEVLDLLELELPPERPADTVEAPPEPSLAPRAPRRRPVEAQATPPRAPATAPAPVPATEVPRATAARPAGRRRAAAAPDMPAHLAPASLPVGARVVLVVTVEGDGSLSRAVVEQPSGWPAFDEAARAWVLARWRFEASGDRFRTRVPITLAR